MSHSQNPETQSMTEEKQQKLADLKRAYVESFTRVRAGATDAELTVAARPFVENLFSLTPSDDDVFDIFLEWVRAPYGRRVHPRRIH